MKMLGLVSYRSAGGTSGKANEDMPWLNGGSIPTPATNA